MSQLEKNLAHSRAAYIFALRSIPSAQSTFPFDCNGFRFENDSQIQSMIVELGWAFFCRYEACLETYLKSKNIKLSKQCSLYDWLKCKNVSVPHEYADGLLLYRQIRNKLHHEDGASLSGSQDEEIHLLLDHLENFYELFVWCANQIEVLG